MNNCEILDDISSLPKQEFLYAAFRYSSGSWYACHLDGASEAEAAAKVSGLKKGEYIIVRVKNPHA